MLYFFLILGGRQANDIVSWLLKKTGPPAKTLASSEDVKEFLEGKEVAALGFFADVESDAAKSYIAAADEIDDVEFGLVSSPEIAAEYKIEGDGILLSKKVCFSLVLFHALVILLL